MGSLHVPNCKFKSYPIKGLLGGWNIIRITERGVLDCARNRGRNENEIVKHENGRKEGCDENCWNGINLILQIGPKCSIQMSFGLHYNPIPFQTWVPNNPFAYLIESHGIHLLRFSPITWIRGHKQIKDIYDLTQPTIYIYIYRHFIFS